MVFSVLLQLIWWRYVLSSFCNSCIVVHAASALVCGLSGCGWFANFSSISPYCHLTLISWVLRVILGSETTRTWTFVGLTINAKVAATFISRGNSFAASSAGPS